MKPCSGQELPPVCKPCGGHRPSLGIKGGSSTELWPFGLALGSTWDASGLGDDGEWDSGGGTGGSLSGGMLRFKMGRWVPVGARGGV